MDAADGRNAGNQPGLSQIDGHNRLGATYHVTDTTGPWRKGRFIEDFWNGDPSLRVMEDLGEASIYDQIAGTYTAGAGIAHVTVAVLLAPAS